MRIADLTLLSIFLQVSNLTAQVNTPPVYQVKSGNSIPQNVVDKIFQQFFTTKPTGEGTGLGLSLASDIIQVHGGTLKVESEDGEGSEFIIQLPIN
jgi:signal transduction histidine kinase